MAFLDKARELGKKVGETTASVAKSAAKTAKEKSEQAIEIGKLKKDVLVENGKITKLYEDIGKHAFDIYNSSKDYSLLEPLFQQINDSLAKIEESKARMEEVKTSADLSDDDLSEFDDDDEDEDENEE
jgi:GTP1/Obg family GTP-binding protein